MRPLLPVIVTILLMVMFCVMQCLRDVYTGVFNIVVIYNMICINIDIIIIYNIICMYINIYNMLQVFL